MLACYRCCQVGEAIGEQLFAWTWQLQVEQGPSATLLAQVWGSELALLTADALVGYRPDLPSRHRPLWHACRLRLLQFQGSRSGMIYRCSDVACVRCLGCGGRFGMPAATAAASFLCRLASSISFFTSWIRCATPCRVNGNTLKHVSGACFQYRHAHITQCVCVELAVPQVASKYLYVRLALVQCRLVVKQARVSMSKRSWTCCSAAACPRVQSCAQSPKNHALASNRQLSAKQQLGPPTCGPMPSSICSRCCSYSCLVLCDSVVRFLQASQKRCLHACSLP